MKVLLIGGTGLLGYETAKKLVNNGHEVISFALPPKTDDIKEIKGMTIIYQNFLELSDDQLLNYLGGCEGLIYASGIDERVQGPKPVYNLYEKYNILPLTKLLPLAKKAGVKSVVILGSYFTYFNRLWPELNLTKDHPYIKSRYDQMKVAFSYYEEDFNIAIIEIPYVFGIQPNREPVWTILVEQIMKMKRKTYWTKGGTALITVNQAATAISNALLINKGANTYPIGYYNMEWPELMSHFHKGLGTPNKKVKIVPNFLAKIYAIYLNYQIKRKGMEPGLNLSKFIKLQSRNQFIEYERASKKLNVENDDIEKAIYDSITLSKNVLENKVVLTKMKTD